MLQALVSERGVDMTAVIRDAIRQYHARTFPAVVVGYVKLDRPGEVEWNKPDSEDNECPECNQPLLHLGAYMAVYADGTMRGPVCKVCATAE